MDCTTNISLWIWLKNDISIQFQVKYFHYVLNVWIEYDLELWYAYNYNRYLYIYSHNSKIDFRNIREIINEYLDIWEWFWFLIFTGTQINCNNISADILPGGITTQIKSHNNTEVLYSTSSWYQLKDIKWV